VGSACLAARGGLEPPPFAFHDAFERPRKDTEEHGIVAIDVHLFRAIPWPFNCIRAQAGASLLCPLISK